MRKLYHVMQLEKARQDIDVTPEENKLCEECLFGFCSAYIDSIQHHDVDVILAVGIAIGLELSKQEPTDRPKIQINQG